MLMTDRVKPAAAQTGAGIEPGPFKLGWAAAAPASLLPGPARSLSALPTSSRRDVLVPVSELAGDRLLGRGGWRVTEQESRVD